MERKTRIDNLMNQKKYGIHFIWMQDDEMVKEQFILAGSEVDRKIFMKYADKKMIIDWRENKTYNDGKKETN